MASSSVIRVSRDSVKKRREARKASQIKTDGFISAIKLDGAPRFYINNNRGISL